MTLTHCCRKMVRVANESWVRMFARKSHHLFARKSHTYNTSNSVLVSVGYDKIPSDDPMRDWSQRFSVMTSRFDELRGESRVVFVHVVYVVVTHPRNSRRFHAARSFEHSVWKRPVAVFPFARLRWRVSGHEKRVPDRDSNVLATLASWKHVDRQQIENAAACIQILWIAVTVLLGELSFGRQQTERVQRYKVCFVCLLVCFSLDTYIQYIKKNYIW